MRYSRTVLIALGVGMVLALPSLWLDFMPSDLIFLTLIEGWYPELGQPFNLYTSFLELPSTQWWASPTTRVTFFRPLASALLRLDHALFGRQALGYHVHSLVWLAALIAVCGLLYRRLPRRVGVLALLLYVVDECLVMPGGLIGNRHALVAVVPALLGLLAHLRWREEGWRPGLPLSLAGFAVGLLGGEMALSVVALVVAYELFAVRAGEEGLGRRLRGLLPVVLLAGGYFVAYKALGYGVTGCSAYLDPVGDPIASLRALAGHVPTLLATALVGYPPEVDPLAIALGLGAVVAVAVFLWRCRSGAAAWGEVRWLLPGALMALVPAALARPDVRQLLVPMIGLAPLLAFGLDTAWQRWRRGWAGSVPRRLGAGAMVLVLVLVHFAGSLPARFVQFFEGFMFNRFHDHVAAQVPLAASPRQLILINSPGRHLIDYLPLAVDRHGERIAPSWHVLSEAPHPIRLSRTGARTLELEVVDGQMLASDGEHLFRSPREPLVAGDVLDDRIFRVEILRGNDRGPTRVAFHFDREIDDPSLVFLAWTDDGLGPAEPPARGESLTFEYYPKPWSFLFPDSEEEGGSAS